MKTKLLSLIAIFIGVTAVEAQQKIEKKTYKDLQLSVTPQQPAYTKFKRHSATTYNKTNAVESHWLNYGYSREWINSGGDVNNPIATGANTYLFPDSIVNVEYGDGNGGTTYGSPFIHNISNVLDVKSPTFQQADSVYWNKFVPYTLDSVSLLYGYNRKHPDPTIVDTLIAYLFTNSTAANMVSNYFQNLTGYTDDVNIKIIKYKYATNVPDVTGMVTIKMPLTVADTATTFLRLKEFSTKDGGASAYLTVPAGKLVGCAFAFKAGYSYVAGDTITKNKNYFTIRSLQENGDNSLPTYMYCNPTPNEDICDWNLSSIVPTDVRYNLSSAQSWKGLYIPSYAYTDGFAFEHHYISYKVTGTLNSGIKESAENELQLGQPIPNPSSGATTVNYELAQDQPVNLAVYDITGKKVMSIDQGRQTAGVHSINLNAREFQSGVYFYTLSAGDNRLTRKMTVIE